MDKIIKGLLLAMVLPVLIISCSTPKTVFVPQMHEVVVRQHDTIQRVDSFINIEKTVVQVADSAMMARFGIRLHGMERAWLIQNDRILQSKAKQTTVQRHDSIVHDSIPVPYPVVKYKEKELSRWQKVEIALGKGMVGILIGLVIFQIWQYYRKFKR